MRHLRDVGWVYALRNAAFRQPLLKIGMTKTSPHQRANELGSATGVPGKFDLVYFFHSMNCVAAEEHVHDALAEYRTTGEFSDVPIARAVDAMDEAAELYPINMEWISLVLGSAAGGGTNGLPRSSSMSSFGALNAVRRTWFGPSQSR